MVGNVDLAIVGAGPAGLGAALAAGQHGLSVAVFDEYPEAGGRLLGQLHRTGGAWHVGRQRARDLVHEAHALPSVTLRLGTTVYSIDASDHGFRLWADPPVNNVKARALVVATGAAEIALPLPGWNLPGAVTVGAAQVMANVWGISPGQKGMVIGLTPLAFAIAQELHWAGVHLGGILPAAEGLGRTHAGSLVEQWDSLLRLRAMAPFWARPGAALLAAPRLRARLLPWLPLSGIPLFGTHLRLGVTAEALEGEDRVQAVRLRKVDGQGQPVGDPWREEIDFALLSGGLRPVPDFFRALRAHTVSMPELGGEVPVVDEDGQTSVPHLFAAGNALGVEGAAVAEVQGRRAGLAAAACLGREIGRSEQARARQAVEDARREAPFAFHPGVAAAHREVLRVWHGVRSNDAVPNRGGFVNEGGPNGHGV